MFQTIHTVLVKQAVLCLYKKVNAEPSGSIFFYASIKASHSRYLQKL